ncbi:MAG: RNA methyltransferase [Candidatus Kapaibacterium sp.]
MRKLTHEEILVRRLTAENALSADRHPVGVMLHNVRSLYNVGSIFRTCDSALAAELVLCGYTPHPPRPEIEKTALGAVDSVPWRYYKDIFKAIKDQKDAGVRVVAVEITESGRPYDSLRAEEYPVCLVMGNELTGLDDEIIAECDSAIEIPMHGVKHSLNVSVATGIALFEAVRTWRALNK